MPRHTTAVQNSACGRPRLSQIPILRGTISGSTKYQRNICTMSGTLRKISTKPPATARTAGDLTVRAMPMADPRQKAIVHAEKSDQDGPHEARQYPAEIGLGDD